MLNFVLFLSIISLTIYIAKSAEPIYLFLKKRAAIRYEKNRIKKQKILYEERGATLLAHGYKIINPNILGLYFHKQGCYNITEAELRGWSDKLFNQSINKSNKINVCAK